VAKEEKAMNLLAKIIGPFLINRIVLCSADASPQAQRNQPGPAAFFFPGGKWVGHLRNVASDLNCRFVILTTGHGLKDKDDIVEPFDRHIDNYPEEVDYQWRNTIPNLIGGSLYDLMIFYSGGCPREPYVEHLRPILHSLGISLLTFGRPNMFDIGKTKKMVELLTEGATCQNIRAILRCPDRFAFYPVQSVQKD
jgi:hypothetical protein